MVTPRNSSSACSIAAVTLVLVSGIAVQLLAIETGAREGLGACRLGIKYSLSSSGAYERRKAPVVIMRWFLE